jgi:hypothetical protein
MRWLALGVVLLVACEGDPVGEGTSDGGGGSAPDASAGASGSSGGGSAGSGGSSGSAGTSGSGGSSGSAGDGGNVLVPGPEGAQGLAVDATHVFYGKGLEVWRVPKSGGNAEKVSAGTVKVREIAVDDQNVYFLDGDKTIRRATKTGGTAAPVVQGAGGFEQFGDIATDGAYVYYSSVEDQINFAGSVNRVAVSGGIPQQIQKEIGADEPRGIYLYAGEIYWANHKSGELKKEAVAGDSPTLLTTGANGPWRVAANATHVFWTESNGSLGYKQYGGVYMVVSGASGPGDDLVLDDKNVYFSAPSASRVYATPLATDSAFVIAECSTPRALATDAAAVYVACEGGGESAVLRVAK